MHWQEILFTIAKIITITKKNQLHRQTKIIFQWVTSLIWFISICRCSHIRENTISSLKEAYSHGADMVEFDVQLSKDIIPVIYHDFELCTTSLSKDGQKEKLIPIQLKNLTLKQLRSLKIHHVNAIDNGVKVNVFITCRVLHIEMYKVYWLIQMDRLRSANVIFFENWLIKHKLLMLTSWTLNWRYEVENINLPIFQSHFTSYISVWDTLLKYCVIPKIILERY